MCELLFIGVRREMKRWKMRGWKVRRWKMKVKR